MMGILERTRSIAACQRVVEIRDVAFMMNAGLIASCCIFLLLHGGI